MTINEAWQELEIEATTDEDALVEAYRTKLMKVHPEDDPEGFKKLREAYEVLTDYLANPPEEENINPDELDEYQRLSYDFNKIYDDFSQRITFALWKEFLNRPIFYDLDTADKARETVLASLLDRFYLPNEIWKEINRVFTIDKDLDSLKEMFPENFLSFIVRHAENSDFIEYDKLISAKEHAEDFAARNIDDIKPDYADVEAYHIDSNFDTPEDNYLSLLFELKYNIDQLIGVDTDADSGLLNNALSFFKALDAKEFWHPMVYIEKMRMYAFAHKNDKASAIARDILNNNAVGDIDYGNAEAGRILLDDYKNLSDDEVRTIRDITDDILGRLPDFFSARLCKSILFYVDGKYEEASEFIVDTINSTGDDPLSLDILNTVNAKLINKYEELVKANPDGSENRILLVRYLCQVERWNDAIEALKDAKITEEWLCDYQWFLGRSLFETEQYKECIPHLTKWNEMLDKIKQEVSETDANDIPILTQHRLNRGNYGYAILGRAYTNTKQYELAEETYDKLASFSDDPSHRVPAIADKATMYYESKNYVSAIDTLDSLINEYGPILPILQMHQDVAYAMNEPQIVIDDFYKIINDAPNVFRPYVVAFRTFLKYKQLADAERVLDLANEQQFDSIGVDFMRAQYNLFNINDSEEAFDILNEFIRIRDIADKAYADNPDNYPVEPADVYYEIAEIACKMLDVGDEPDIDLHETVKKAYNIAPDNWDYAVPCQHLLTKLYGNSMPSDELLKLLAKGDAPTGDIYYICAAYYANNNDFRQAIPLLIRTIELNPSHPEAHNALQRMYLLRYTEYEDRSDIEEAGKEATLQLKNSDSSYYYVERGLYYQEIGEHNLAIMDFKAAIAKAPGNVYAYNGIGRSLTALKRYDEAEQVLLKAISLLEEDDIISIPYENIAKLYGITGEYSKAVDYLKQMIAKCGDNTTDSDAVARMYLKNRQYSEASDMYLHCFEMLDKYLENNPNSTWAIYRLVKQYISLLDLSFIAGEHEKDTNEKLASFVQFLENAELRLHPKNKGLINVLKKNKYEAIEPIADPDSQAFLADVYYDIGMFLLYTLRDYDRALMYFFRQNKYMNYDISSATINELDYKGDLFRQIATCYAFLGDMATAKKYAEQALSWYLYYKSDSQYLNNTKYVPLRSVNLGITFFLAGYKDYKKYFNISEQSIPSCTFCKFSCCYEEFLLLARIAEITGDYKKAKELYQTAFEKSRDDCEAKVAIKRCEELMKGN